MPDFTIEDAVGGCVAGIDEVGRGPLAGPVVAAALVLDRGRLSDALRDGLDDSKRLSAARRRDLAARLADCAWIGIGEASVAEIDDINILQATFLAMRRAFDAVIAAGAPAIGHALIDGPRCPVLPCPTQAVVGGDGRSLSIAAASVVAKVHRDALMAALAEAWPGYGWERNAGYGTAAHLAALDQRGVTSHHRRSFAPVARLLSS